MSSEVFVFGGSGLVGSRFIELNRDHFDFIAPTLDEVDILDPQQINRALEESGAKVVVNFAAFTDVDRAEKEIGNKEGIVYKLNSKAALELARVCQYCGCYLIQISTSYVFNGKSELPYKESDQPSPVNWYGQTKYFGEQFVVSSGVKSCVLRLERPYRAKYNERSDFARFFLEKLKSGEKVRAVEDQMTTPVFIDDVARALRIIIDRQSMGIYHLVSTDSVSPFQFVNLLAKKFGFDPTLIQGTKFADFYAGKEIERVQNSALDTTKFTQEFGPGILHSNEQGIELLRRQIVSLNKQ